MFRCHRSEQDAGPQNSKQASAAVTVLQPDNSETRVHSTLAQEVEKSTSGWWLVWLTAALRRRWRRAVPCVLLARITATPKLSKPWTARLLDNCGPECFGTRVARLNFRIQSTPEAQLVLRTLGKRLPRTSRVWIHMWIERYPLRVGLPTPPADFRMATSSCLLAVTLIRLYPKSHRYHLRQFICPGTPAGQIYVYGEIQYLDVFQITRLTKYRLIYGGPEGARDDRTSHDAEGNIATWSGTPLVRSPPTSSPPRHARESAHPGRPERHTRLCTPAFVRFRGADGSRGYGSHSSGWHHE